jgi:hypothetical protein
MHVLLTEHYSDDRVKKNEMHGACSMHGEEERCRQVCGGTNLRERENFESRDSIGELY